MTSAELDLEVLGCLLDDYENASTLSEDIARTTASHVTDQHVHEALERLVQTGLAVRYAFDSSRGLYVRAEQPLSSPSAANWYMASETGRALANS